MIGHILRLIWNRRRASWLVTVEIAAAFLVVFVVFALSLHAWSNYRQPLGFAYENVWRVSVANDGLGADPHMLQREIRASRDQILAAIRLLPGVVGAHSITSTPFSGFWGMSSLGPPGHAVWTKMNGLSSEALKDLGVPVVAGRMFGPADEGQDYRAALVNRYFADHVLSGDPIGQRINFPPPGDPRLVAQVPPEELREALREIRVVGVIEDFRQDGEFAEVMPYVILREEPVGYVPTDLFVKVASGTDRRLEERIVATVSMAASGFSGAVTSWEELREANHVYALLPFRVGATLAVFLLAMVALGLIGIVWQDVVRRTQEIGVRRAAGASAGAVRSQILLEVLVIGSAGIVIGGLLAIQIPLLMIVKQIDWAAALPALGLSTALILLLAASAALYPALLASHRDPALALRFE